MKKILVIICAFCSLTVNAQTFKDFLSDVDYNLSVGLSWSQCDKEYDNQKFGIAFGIDAQKPILHFPNESSTIYGLVGLHYETKGGKNTNDFFESLENEDATISASHLKVPLRAGFSYQFKKFSLFVDMGPYLSMKLSDNGNEYVEMSSTEFGFGGTMGIKFKRFAFSMGADNGITDFATKKDDNMTMKNTTSHMDFRWTF